MIYLIKTDKEETYFFNKETKRIQSKYEKDDNLVLVTKLEDGRVINIENPSINLTYGGQLTFDFEGNKFIVEDGFRNNLIRAGYIIKDRYDNEDYHIYDKDEGLAIRQSIYDKLLECIKKYVHDTPGAELDTKIVVPNIRFTVTDEHYRYTICLDTINSIVSKNQQRKSNNLTFYPFLKDMDKYGTFYMSVFIQYIGTEEELTNDIIKYKYTFAENLIAELMVLLNQNDPESNYKFERIIVRKKIGFEEGI